MLNIQHPTTKEVVTFKFVEASVCMGLKLSPYWFETLVQSFTKACIFHRSDLFGGPQNLALLYSYLDDFMCGSGSKFGSLNCAMTHSLNQMAYLRAMGDWLGLTFKASKTEVPRTWQNILGLTLDTLNSQVSLKDGKALKVSLLISEILECKQWKLKPLQKVSGNCIWLSMLLPRIRAFLTPLIEVQKFLQHPHSKSLPKSSNRLLDDEATRALSFLREVFQIDPAVHVKTFLNIKSVSKVIA